MDLIPSLKTTVLTLLPEKAHPAFVSVLGIVMLVIAVFLIKRDPRLAIFEGSVREVRAVQPEKALSPMLVTLSGMVMLAMLLQSINA